MGFLIEYTTLFLMLPSFDYPRIAGLLLFYEFMSLRFLGSEFLRLKFGCKKISSTSLLSTVFILFSFLLVSVESL